VSAFSIESALNATLASRAVGLPGVGAGPSDLSAYLLTAAKPGPEISVYSSVPIPLQCTDGVDNRWEGGVLEALEDLVQGWYVSRVSVSGDGHTIVG
jgi:hypothetical protein